MWGHARRYKPTNDNTAPQATRPTTDDNGSISCLYCINETKVPLTTIGFYAPPCILYGSLLYSNSQGRCIKKCQKPHITELKYTMLVKQKNKMHKQIILRLASTTSFSWKVKHTREHNLLLSFREDYIIVPKKSLPAYQETSVAHLITTLNTSHRSNFKGLHHSNKVPNN